MASENPLCRKRGPKFWRLGKIIVEGKCENKGLPLPLGRGVCETKSKNGRSRPRKTLYFQGFLCSEAFRDHGLRPWSRKGPDHGVGVDPETVSKNSLKRCSGETSGVSVNIARCSQRPRPQLGKKKTMTMTMIPSKKKDDDKRATTNVQHWFVQIFLLSFLLFCSHWAKTLRFEGESPGGKSWKSVKNYENCETFWNDFALQLLPFSFSLTKDLLHTPFKMLGLRNWFSRKNRRPPPPWTGVPDSPFPSPDQTE